MKKGDFKLVGPVSLYTGYFREQESKALILEPDIVSSTQKVN